MQPKLSRIALLTAIALSALPALAAGQYQIQISAKIELAPAQSNPPDQPQVPEDPIVVELNQEILPVGTVGASYSFDFMSLISIGGDTGAYAPGDIAWSLASGSLPDGLTLNANGTITGTPTAAGSSSMTLRAVYKTVAGEQSYTVSVKLAVSLQSATLPAATVGAPYSYDFKALLQAQGDTSFDASQAAWSLASGSLPSGLSFSNGMIVGTPSSFSDRKMCGCQEPSGFAFRRAHSAKSSTGRRKA